MSRPYINAPVDEQKDPLHASILDGDIPRLRQLLASGPLPSYTPVRADCATETDSDDTKASVDLGEFDDRDLDSQGEQVKQPCSTLNGSPLQFAACLGNLAAVDALLDAGADPEWATEERERHPPETPKDWTESFTPIHLATFYGHRRVAARLWARSTLRPLDSGQDEDISNSYDYDYDVRWVLCRAAELGQLGIVQDLLASGVQWGQKHLEAALEGAAARWDPHVATELRERQEPYIYSQKALDRALDRACRHKCHEHPWSAEFGLCAGMEYANQSALITRLIKAGADPNRMSYEGRPLITTAANVADMTVALGALLGGGADPNLKDEHFGLTALSTAVGTVAHTAGDPDLDQIQYVWNETALRLLLDHGASATARSLDGTTPLHIAARVSNPRFFNLVAESSSIAISQLRDLKNDFGETLLHFACLGGQIDIIEMLLDHGFDANQKSALGWTPFLCALTPDARDRWDRRDDWKWKEASNAVQAAHLLIARGADTRIVSDSGWTPLHVLSLHQDTSACHNGVYSLGLRLFERDRSALSAPAPKPVRTEERLVMWEHHRWDRPWKNRPLLQWAIESESLTVAKLMLAIGADPTEMEADGITAIEAAEARASRTELEWWKELRQLLAEVTEKNKNKNSGLDATL